MFQESETVVNKIYQHQEMPSVIKLQFIVNYSYTLHNGPRKYKSVKITSPSFGLAALSELCSELQK